MTGVKLQLDREELQILRDFGRGEFESVRDFRKEKRRLEETAGHTLRKDKRINIRISSRDFLNSCRKYSVNKQAKIRSMGEDNVRMSLFHWGDAGHKY